MEVKLYQTPQINFKAMKSSQFKSLEYSAMRKFKAPIEKFNGINDFYSWASHKCKELTSKELGGRNPAIQAKRNAMKQDWVNYIMRVKKLSQPVALMILASIFKGLKPDNSDLLPQLNEDVFEKTLNDVESSVEKDRESLFDYKKQYVANLRQSFTGNESWVVIPSKASDKENYEQNLEKLKALSPRTWCTKNDKAEDYLSDCDIHIYFSNGSPEIGIRLKGGKVYDIVGFENNGKIPQKYLSEVNEYLDKNSFKLGLEAQDQIDSAKSLQAKIQEVRNNIGEAIDTNDVFSIMEYFNFQPEKLNDGTISITGYMQPRGCTFAELGINENKLFEKISHIRGNAFFRNCSATSLKNIAKIDGMVNFADSSILETGALEEVGGEMYLASSKVRSFPNLKLVNGEKYQV